MPDILIYLMVTRGTVIHWMHYERITGR